MRFKIEIELENEHLNLDYRPVFISLFKHSLTEYDNGIHFDTYYAVEKEKPFTFSVQLPESRFTKEKIIVPNKKINVIFSTGDMGTGIIFFNALSMQKNKKHPLAFENSITIKSISIEREFAITKEAIEIRFKAPLCIREHEKSGNKDIYYSTEKEGFNNAFMSVIEYQIQKSNSLPKSILDDFSIEPINAKKTVVRHHNQFIESSLGIFILRGNQALLNYLYTNGIGSRKSSGFGLFEIVSEGMQ